MGYLISSLFIIIPIGAVVFFVVSLCRFLSARNKHRQDPGSIDEQTLSSRKTMLIVSSVIAGILVATVIGLAILLLQAIRYM